MFYDHLFLGFYKLTKKYVPKSEQPVLNVILLLSFLMACNIWNLIMIMQIAIGFKLINLDNISAYTIIAIPIMLLALHYYFLVYKKRYRIIIEKLDSTNSEKIATTYFIISILLGIISIGFLFLQG